MPPAPPVAPARRKARSRLEPAAAPPASAADRLVLSGADWGTYVRLADDPGNAGLKFTFDGSRGLLEIEVAHGPQHESLSRLLFTLVLAFARARDVDLAPSGSVTVRREDVGRGCEPDESFYITHRHAIPAPGTNLLDLAAGQAPPDLVIEIDVTSPGVAKLPIYAALGVPEVWVWTDERITARRLAESGGYEVVADSVELPGFPLTVAAELLANRPWSLLALERAFQQRLPAAGGG